MSSTRSLVLEIPSWLFALTLAACGGGGGGGYGGGSGGGSTGASPSLLSVFAGDPTGAGNTGSNDAQGTAARFKGPAAIATDAAGNVYVADSMNSTVRKITPAGDVTTPAGQVGVFVTANGTGNMASFRDLEGIAVDSLGNVFVTDGLDGVIRKITPTGDVSTFAGTVGSHDSTDDTGAAARFGSPRGIAVDASNNLYVTDATNSNIRMITPGAVVTTIAGPTGAQAGQTGTTDQTGTAARFNGPLGIAADSAGNLYVADTFNSSIRKITVSGGVGTVSTISGTGVAFPHSLTVDPSGNVYVADFGNSVVRKITPGGATSVVVGSTPGFSMGPLPGMIAGPFGTAVSGTSLYIVSPSFSCVFLVTDRP
jgi:sugar lactone lactonase YvrE